MIPKANNPYFPGAGVMPKYLAGREGELNILNAKLDALNGGIPQRSIVYYGLRGVGKTVLLTAIEKKASDKNIYCQHIEITNELKFVPTITTAANKFLRTLSKKEKLKNIIDRAIDAIKSLTISFAPSEVKFEIEPREKELYLSSDYEQSLSELFEALGEAAQSASRPVCFFIDEIQFMKKEDLSALICALHRVNQLGYPIMLISAGLPKIFKLIGNAKTYAERIFEYREIDSLTEEQAEDAIKKPAEEQGKQYEADAIKAIIEETGAYPYFIQEFCNIIWNDSNENIICLKDVLSAKKDYINRLDNGFFMVRFQRTSEKEREFMYAMVDCGELPCTIGNVAKNLNKKVQQISTTRAQLINKGLIYPTSYGEIDFTVPKFDAFLNRKRMKY